MVLVVDARAGLMPDDSSIAAALRRQGKKVLVAANKVEGKDDGLAEFARLGFDRMVPISAEHGQGVGDLLDAALEGLPRVEPVEDEAHPLRIALVGRPNVGKSSLLNRLLGSERAVVSAIPGTTRDAVDSLLVKGDKRYLFVDTAGIRRVRHLKENVDHVSVVQARRSIDRADVAILLLDAVEGMREMDATIAGYIQEAGRGVVLAVNKWDKSRELGLGQRAFEEAVRDDLKFLAYAPVVFISAADRQGPHGPPRSRGAGARGLADPHHHRPAQPRPGKGRPGQRPQGGQGRSAGEDPVRHPDRGRAAHLRPLHQPPGGPPFFLQALPGKQVAGGVRLRGDAARAEGPTPAALAAVPFHAFFLTSRFGFI